MTYFCDGKLRPGGKTHIRHMRTAIEAGSESEENQSCTDNTLKIAKKSNFAQNCILNLIDAGLSSGFTRLCWQDLHRFERLANSDLYRG